MDEQEDEEYFDNLINDIHHQHNDGNDSDYVPYNSDEDDDILGSWEAEYDAMDEEEGTIVTDELFPKKGAQVNMNMVATKVRKKNRHRK